MRVEERGLTVHPNKGFMAASPDRIVYKVRSEATDLVK